MNEVNTARVNLWGTLVGAVLWNPEKGFAAFEFDKRFLDKSLDLAPLKMPLSEARRGIIFEFRDLPKDTFKGLPGMLADALPDNFGNRIIDAWLARQGRTPQSLGPVERLCYTGKRAMGALEFEPSYNTVEQSVPVDVSELLKLVQEVTNELLAVSRKNPRRLC